MLIIGYDDLVLLIALFLMTMVALVAITASVVFRLLRMTMPQIVFPKSDPEELKTFINRT